MCRPSGENTHASGSAGAALADVNRRVAPLATSVTHTPPSMTCAIARPSGLHVKAEAIPDGLRVICRSAPPRAGTSQSCTTPASSIIRNAICVPSGDARSQWRGAVTTPGNFRSAVNVSRRCTTPAGGAGRRVDASAAQALARGRRRVSRRLGRRFIGIEREEDYAEAALARIDATKRLPPEALQVTTSKRAEPRIPFGQLVERGMLRPGEVLTSINGKAAKVRADGSLVADGINGSIHQVGAALEGAPSCNGWTYWCFRRDGKTVPIDVLRQQLRAELEH